MGWGRRGGKGGEEEGMSRMDLASSPCDSRFSVDKTGPQLDSSTGLQNLDLQPKGKRHFRIICIKLMSENEFPEPLNADQNT